MAIYKTVGELIDALADIERDAPLLSRAWGAGAFFNVGVEADFLKVNTVGEGQDTGLVSVNDEVFAKWKGPKGEPFTGMLFE